MAAHGWRGATLSLERLCFLLALVLLCMVVAWELFPWQPTAVDLCLAHPDSRRAIVLLLSQHRLAEARDNLHLLFTNFNDAFRYPVILFCERSLSERRARRVLRRKLNASQLCLVRFRRVDFKFPEGFNHREALRRGVVFRRRFPGYQHMCAFWFRHVFEVPEVRALDYYLRLDTDSVIHNPIRYDLFDYFQAHGFKYGYRMRLADPVQVTQGLWQFAADYIRRHHLHPPSTIQVPPPQLWNDTKTMFPTYYNNFEIVHIPTIISRPDIQEYIAAVSDTFRIYTHRWGDAPLRFLLVQLFLNVSADVHQCCDVHYTHQAVTENTCVRSP